MKITYFLTDLGYTGGPLTLYNFMNKLVEFGHDVYVVTPYEHFQWDKDTYLKYIGKRSKVKIALRMLRRKLANILIGQKVFVEVAVIVDELIEKYKDMDIDSDILIATYPYTIDAAMKLGKNKKIVMHNQHYEEHMFRDYADIAQIRVLNYYPVNHIVNCSWLYKMFKYNYGFDPIVVTPGIDTEIFFEEKDGATKYSNIERLKIISYCDPQRPFKGYDQQMRIFKKLYEINGDAIEIQFFGNDPKTDDFKYVFLGKVPQKKLAEYYRQAHIMAMFSWYESFPLPPIEAMACGCAVVSTKYGTEDYLEDGVTGRLINSFDINGSVKIINGLIHDPDVLLQYVKNARNVVGRFTWQEQSEKLNAFLSNLPSRNYVDVLELQKGNYDELRKIENI